MSTASPQILSVDVPCDPGAARTVRTALMGMNWREGVDSDVLIVASELVNNAVVHSGCGREDVLTARAALSVDRLMFSIHDPGRSGRDAVVRADGDSDAGGRGLRLVERLSTRWGSHRGDGLRVWAEIAVVGSPDPLHGVDRG